MGVRTLYMFLASLMTVSKHVDGAFLKRTAVYTSFWGFLTTDIGRFYNVSTYIYNSFLKKTYVAVSVVLKHCHIKDPQKNMYLAVDPHLKMFFQGPLEGM